MYFILRNATPQIVCDEQMDLTEKQPEATTGHCLQLTIYFMELRSFVQTFIIPNINSSVQKTVF